MQETIEPPDLELGGVKLPLEQIMQLVAVPRVRDSGGWFVSAVTGNVYAEVKRRKWMAFRQHSMVCRTITPAPGDVQDRDLRVFAYDVLINAGSAYEQ